MKPKPSFCVFLTKSNPIMDHRSLNLITFNVRSLVDTSRQIDLRNTLFHNKIDIGFIQECHLRRNKKVKIDGYNFIYDNSPLGVAVLIKSSFQYNRLIVNNIGINSSFIQIESSSENIRKKYLIGSIYIPCNYPAQKIVSDLNKILQICGNFDGFILGGDLNSKYPSWGDSSENSNGKTLQKWLEDNSLDVVRVCDSTPSYPNGPSFLDHFLLSPHLIDMVIPNYEISTMPTFSDHFPIKLELKLKWSGIILKNTRTFTSYKNTNWNNFRRDMDIASQQLMPPTNRNLEDNEIDSMIRDFNNTFTSIHDLHTQKLELKGEFPLLNKKVLQNKASVAERTQKNFSPYRKPAQP